MKTLADFNDSALNSNRRSMPGSAIVLPDGNVIIADSIQSRVSEYIVNGTLKQHLLTKDDKIYNPVYLTFSYPHLWVLGYSRHKNILNRYRLNFLQKQGKIERNFDFKLFHICDVTGQTRHLSPFAICTNPVISNSVGKLISQFFINLL